MCIERKFIIKWKNLTEEAKNEYKQFLNVPSPIEDKNGDLVSLVKKWILRNITD